MLGAFGFSFAFGVSWVQNTFRDYQGLLYGATGLLAVATAPEGTVGNLRRYLRWFNLRRARKGQLRRQPPPEARWEPRRRPGPADGPLPSVDGDHGRFSGASQGRMPPSAGRIDRIRSRRIPHMSKLRT